MKLKNYVDWTHTRKVNEKEMPLSYFMLEIDIDGREKPLKVLIQPVDKHDYAILRKVSEKVIVSNKNGHVVAETKYE